MAAHLPVTLFEQYMLDDDTQAYPMVFFLRSRLRGRLVREHFEQALRQAIDRHPLLRAVLQDHGGQTTWLPLENETPDLHWCESDTTGFGPRSAQRLDLRRQPGLRVWVQCLDQETTVLWEFHHACTDGTGGMQLIEDTLVAYAAACDAPGTAPAWRTLDDPSLEYRRTFGLDRIGRIARLPLDLLGAFGVAQFFANRPRALAADRPAHAPADDACGGPSTQSHTFTAVEVRRLQAACAERGATINDVLIRDLMTTLDAWQAEKTPHEANPCLRISVPVNLRQDRAAAMPAANVVSMVFVDRRPRRYRPAALLASIRRDTWFIKRLRLGLVFMLILQFFARITRGMGWLLGGSRCLSTAVLSNLGVQFDRLPLRYQGRRAVTGNVVLEQIELLPPLRRLTRAALGVVTYAGELTLSLHYDASCFDSSSARILLDRYVSTVRANSAVWPELVAHPAPSRKGTRTVPSPALAPAA
ncbi:MAG: hypothetical protein K1X74_17660 [Pirellulales bacterium]|nr:hypothetical protein [Pirellulales bacterium]